MTSINNGTQHSSVMEEAARRNADTAHQIRSERDATGGDKAYALQRLRRLNVEILPSDYPAGSEPPAETPMHSGPRVEADSTFSSTPASAPGSASATAAAPAAATQSRTAAQPSKAMPRANTSKNTWHVVSGQDRSVLGQAQAKDVLTKLLATVRMNALRSQLTMPTHKLLAPNELAAETPEARPLSRVPLNLNMIVSTPGGGEHELQQYGGTEMLRQFVTDLHANGEVNGPKLVEVDSFELQRQCAEAGEGTVLRNLIEDARKSGALLINRAFAAPETLLFLLNDELKKPDNKMPVFFGGPKGLVENALRRVNGANLDTRVHRELPITLLSAKDVAARMREIASEPQLSLVAPPYVWSQSAQFFVNQRLPQNISIDDALRRFITDAYERLCVRVTDKFDKRGKLPRNPQLQAARLMQLTLDDTLGASRPNIEAIKKLAEENALTPELQSYFIELYNLANLVERVNRTKKDGEPMAELNKIFTAGVLLAGPKGVGKSTSVDAIALANFHARLTVDPKPVIKVPADLKKGFLGQSGQAALALLQEVIGKTLFMDEFHNLITSPQDQYGIEVSAVLMWGREYYRELFAMVGAGYPGPLARLFGFEQGWSSRFPFRVNLPAWPAEKASKVFPTKIAELNLGVEISKEAQQTFEEKAAWLAKQAWWGSGRDTRTIAADAVTAMAKRVAADPNAVLRLEPVDIISAVDKLAAGRSMDELDDGGGPNVTSAAQSKTAPADAKPLSEEEQADIQRRVLAAKDKLEAEHGDMFRQVLNGLLEHMGVPVPPTAVRHEA